MIAALKAVLAHYSADGQWATLRPPLVELTAGEERELVKALERVGFSMPGLARVVQRESMGEPL